MHVQERKVNSPLKGRMILSGEENWGGEVQVLCSDPTKPLLGSATDSCYTGTAVALDELYYIHRPSKSPSLRGSGHSTLLH